MWYLHRILLHKLETTVLMFCAGKISLDSNAFRDGAFVASQGNLCQWLTTL